MEQRLAEAQPDQEAAQEELAAALQRAQQAEAEHLRHQVERLAQEGSALQVGRRGSQSVSLLFRATMGSLC